MNRGGGGGGPGGGGASSAQQRCVFVGNIPYDATEEQLTEIFSSVGPVICFRLVFDRDTGKPKGFGFCEYKDTETAMSAMRNLNGHEINGRSLRVDFAEKESKGRSAGGPGPGGLPTGAGGRRAPPMPAGPSRPGAGFVPPPGLPPAEASRAHVDAVLEGMSTYQLYDMIAQMKSLIEQNPEQARQILEGNPQFAYALLQAELILGMTNPQVVKQLLEGMNPGIQTPPIPPQPIPSHPIPSHPPAVPPGIGGPSSGGYGGGGGFPVQPGPMGGPGLPLPGAAPMYGMGGPGAGIPVQSQMGNPGLPAGMPPMGGMSAGPGGIGSSMGPLPSLPGGAAPSQISLDQQKGLLQQILLLTPQQIERLPPPQREQILMIQRQAGALLQQQS